jgi:hypothetical protein
MWNARTRVWSGALAALVACSSDAAPPEQTTVPATSGASEAPAADGGKVATKASGAAGTQPTAATTATRGEIEMSSSGSGGQSGQAGAAGASSAAGSSAEPADAAAGSGGVPASSAPTEKFSFFITSLRGMIELSKSDQGFGGDLRFGKPTGLEGADAICTTLAEQSMPGSGVKGWRAFLSAAKGGDNAGPVHAKDRVGMGPWYDRLGRLVANNVADLLHERPVGADPAIADDLPNERGEPNHSDTMGDMEDNHDVVTGTNKEGLWDGNMTCQDWTSTETPADAQPGEMTEDDPLGLFTVHGPGLGHSWPGGRSGGNWIAAHQARGCGAVVALVQTGPGMGTGIGAAGGYGAIYCFALKP